jgi:cyclohexanone monooxygenase
VVARALETDAEEVEVSAPAEAAWIEMLESNPRSFGGDPSCTPGYYNNEGKPGALNGQNGFYGGGSVQFFRILEEWRAEGGMRGLELR